MKHCSSQDLSAVKGPLLLVRFTPQPSPEASRRRAISQLYREARHRNTPEARGLRLLRSWLSPEQRAQFDACGHFDVIGSNSGKRYRILFGVSANIQELGDDDQPKIGWCFVPSGYLVPGDVMLAQKIALETDEHGALAVANRLTETTPVQRQVLRRPF
jgi:hypothetical protein